MRKVIEKHKWSVGALKRCVDAYVQHDGRLCYVGKKNGNAQIAADSLFINL